MNFVKMVFVCIMFLMFFSCNVSEESENDIDSVSKKMIENVGIIGGCYQSKTVESYYFCIESFDGESERFIGTTYIIDKKRFNDINRTDKSDFSDYYVKTMLFIGMKTEFIEQIKKDNETIFKIGYCYVRNYDKEKNPFINKNKNPDSLICIKDKKDGYILINDYVKKNQKWYVREDSSNINYYVGWFDNEYGLEKDLFVENTKKVKK